MIPDRSEGDINITPRRGEWQSRNIGSETEALLKRDSEVFIHQSLSTPCLDVLKSCSGSKITNIEGRSYYDFHGNSVHQGGFCNEYILNGIKEQLDTLPFSPRRFTNVPAIELAERLIKISPKELTRTLFTPSGTAANGLAIKLMRRYTGKHKVVSMWDSFHGAGLDMISYSGESIFRRDSGPLLSGGFHIPPPSKYRGFFSNHSDSLEIYSDYLEYVLKREGDIGGMIAETIRCTDVTIPDKEYWKRVREICDHYGVVLILDEIPTALGRTGKMFAFEHFDITPDILTLGKGLGGGVIPMAAVITKEKFNCCSDVAMGHYTHEKSPLGARAATALLDYFNDYQVLESVSEKERIFSERLNLLKGRYPMVGDVRGLGMLWGVELVKDRATKEKGIDEAERILYYSLENGLSFKISGGNVLTLAPPLTIEVDDLHRALDILEDGFKNLG